MLRNLTGNPGLDLKGKKFTLGTFVGEVEEYLKEKNSFLVKFNGVDIMEVDAATVLNLIFKQEVEAKAEEALSPSTTHIPIHLSTKLQNDVSQNISIQEQIARQCPVVDNGFSTLQTPAVLPQIGTRLNTLSPSVSSLQTTLRSGVSLSSFTAPYHGQTVSEALFPMTNSLSSTSLANNLQFLKPGAIDPKNRTPWTSVPGFGFNPAPGSSTVDAPLTFNRLSKGCFQEGVRRHRSTSQPQPVTEKYLVGSSRLGKVNRMKSRRRESLCSSGLGRVGQLQNLTSIHENINAAQLPLVNSFLKNEKFHRHPIQLNQIRGEPLSPAGLQGTYSGTNSGSSDATKTEIFKIIRSLYQNTDLNDPSLPAYSEIEEKLNSESYINAIRLSTLRARFIMKRTLLPIAELLPVEPEKYVVNTLINICPLCGTSISLNKLGSQINWFKHLTGTHGKLGHLIAARFEFFETNMDPKLVTEPKLPMEHFRSHCFDGTISSINNLGNRRDMAPINEDLSIPPKHQHLIPYTTSYCLESLLLNNLINEDILTDSSILLQEILVYGLIKYDLLPLLELQATFPELFQFQINMRSVSEEAFEYYVSAGHPNLIDSPETGSAPVRRVSTAFLEKLIREKIPLRKEEGHQLNWRVLLLNQALEDKFLDNCSIMIQEILVLAFFYYGFITQRTPKKFRIFGKLLFFFGELYKLSCKCYDLYVGDGPTGAEHTRGKPVNPSKLIIQNYNHYGLSRKSLQRALAKEGKDLSSNLESAKQNNFHSVSTLAPELQYKIDESRSRFGGVMCKRGSIKRKTSEHVGKSRRRKSSILNYVAVEQGNCSTQLHTELNDLETTEVVAKPNSLSSSNCSEKNNMTSRSVNAKV